MTIDGVEHFIGSPSCFKRFPERKMSGYWVVGFEYSVYYADRPQAVWELDPNAVWLSLSEDAGQAAAPYLADGKPHLLQVEFVGINPGRLGVYGVGFRDGVHMTRLLRVQELADVEWRRGVAPDTSPERMRKNGQRPDRDGVEGTRALEGSGRVLVVEMTELENVRTGERIGLGTRQ
jgi:hypothetical protein